MGDLLQAMELSGEFPDTKFAYPIENRLKAFEKVCLEHVSAEELRATTTWAIQGFKNTIDDRNALAHGVALLVPHDQVVEMLKFSPTSEDKYALTKFVFDLRTMDAKVREYEFICQTINGSSWTIAISLGLAHEKAAGHSVSIQRFQ